MRQSDDHRRRQRRNDGSSAKSDRTTKSIRSAKSAGYAKSAASAVRHEPRGLSNAVLAAIIIVGLLMGLALAGAVYVNDLLGRVNNTKSTGNFSLRLEDIVDPDDYVDKADTADSLAEAQKGYDTVQKIAVRSDKEVYNILLVGSDRREGEKNGRSDAMMILTINKKTKQIRLTSLMRSMYVKIPGKGWSMLNHTFSWGGAPLLLQTITDNYRIRIDDYAVIDFSGFSKAIDTVGGVEILMIEKEVLYLRQLDPHFSVKTGINQMNGELALAYSRIRKIDSDYVRTSRQRRVIDALITKAKGLSIGRINDLAITLFPLIQTNLSKSQLLGLIAEGVSARTFPTSQMMLPIENSYKTIVVNKTQMIQFDLPGNVAALHQFIFGG
jgi:LCP family protein required for cell wall assembly